MIELYRRHGHLVGARHSNSMICIVGLTRSRLMSRRRRSISLLRFWTLSSFFSMTACNAVISVSTASTPKRRPWFCLDRSNTCGNKMVTIILPDSWSGLGIFCLQPKIFGIEELRPPYHGYRIDTEQNTTVAFNVTAGSRSIAEYSDDRGAFNSRTGENGV